MAKVKVRLDKRADHMTKDGKYPLVLRIGHQSKSRDIGFDIHLFENQFDETTHKITGIQNAVRHSKRVQKIFGDVDLWIDDNKGEIKLWSIAYLKDQIERRFFKKQSQLNLLEHAANYFDRFRSKGKHSTISSYEDGLKALVKFNMKKSGLNDRVIIKTLFDFSENNEYKVKEAYKAFDMPIKAFNKQFAKDFEAYMAGRFPSKNTVNIYLRSIQAILNDAEDSYDELKDHKPLAGIKKASTPNTPAVLTMSEINAIRSLNLEEGTSKFHVKNYFLFMFNNMGMNIYDVALAKVNQFDGERFSYTRKKTEDAQEEDFFSIKQSPENLKIIEYYLNGQDKDDYLFPLIPKGTPEERIFRVKNDKSIWFNNNIKKIAAILGIETKITTYTARDTWVNEGLSQGIDIRKISAGLGHSTVEVTEKHYAQKMKFTILDQINATITGVV